jgi:RNA polymerase sigma-70 factor (ECF subfamily)
MAEKARSIVCRYDGNAFTPLPVETMSNNENVNSLFIALRTTLARAVSHIVPPREVEDIVQETYVRVCQVGERDDIHHPRSFMLRTARNLALDHRKRSESRLADSMEDLQEDLQELSTGVDDTYDRVAANQEFGYFCEAVRQLPQQCRKAFVLRKVYGYSQKEIADSLGISENTVEKHIATGIKRCTGYMMALKAGDLHDVSRQSVSNSQMADEPSHEEAPMAKAGVGHE